MSCTRRTWRASWYGGLAFAVFCGCQRGPARVEAPRWDPPQLAAQAFRRHDVNQDGALDAAELQAVPGLAAALPRLDADQSGALEQAELVQRFELYARMRVGLETASLRVTYNGRPLAGATVRLIPEAFQGEVIEPAAGVADEYGVVTPAIQGQSLPGARLGFYRVQVESPALKSARALRAVDRLGVELSPISEGPASSDALELAIRG